MQFGPAKSFLVYMRHGGHHSKCRTQGRQGEGSTSFMPWPPPEPNSLRSDIHIMTLSMSQRNIGQMTSSGGNPQPARSHFEGTYDVLLHRHTHTCEGQSGCSKRLECDVSSVGLMNDVNLYTRQLLRLTTRSARRPRSMKITTDITDQLCYDLGCVI